jgi:hypothetical protein
MTKKKLRPRPNQIAELTNGENFPLPPVASYIMEIIAERILWAWEDLMSRHNDIISADEEPEITTLLESCLMNMRSSDKLWEGLVSIVIRGKESLSYDGTHLEVIPDLSIYLSGRNPSFPTRVECKIIDGKNQKGIDKYCKNGLIKFIDGRYGWDSQEAFMVAYVRDNSVIRSTLTPFLEKSQKRPTDTYRTERLPEVIETLGSVDATRSCHGRGFRYLHQAPPNDPRSITLWHLWLPCQYQSPGSGSVDNWKSTLLPVIERP